MEIIGHPKGHKSEQSMCHRSLITCTTFILDLYETRPPQYANSASKLAAALWLLLEENNFCENIGYRN